MRLSCVLLSLIFSVAAVLALPIGAPLCNPGETNVRYQHLMRITTVFGALKEFNFTVTLDGVPLVATGAVRTINPFVIGKDIKVQVSSPKSLLKGVLILFSKKGDLLFDTKKLNALTPVGTYKAAAGCENQPRAGVSHSERSLKQTADAILRYDNASDVMLMDVTVVVQNNVTGSVYFYSQYELKGKAAGGGKCGLLGLSLFCPLTSCGAFGKLLKLCKA